MRCVSVAAAVGLLLSAPVSGASTPEQSLNRLGRQISYRFAACVVKHHAGGASRAILRNVDDRTLRTDYTALFDSGCMTDNVGMGFGGDTFRYGLADALVARVLAQAPVPTLTNIPPLDHARPATPLKPLKPNAGEDKVIQYQLALQVIERQRLASLLSSYGECIVRKDPGGAKNLLTTEPESPEEPKRFAALQPAFQTCIPGSETVTFNKAVLRGTVALNYYRLAQAAMNVPVR